METLRAFLSGCMASLSFSSPKGSAEALPEVFCPLQNLPAPSHTANICRIRRLPTLTERLCEIAGIVVRTLRFCDFLCYIAFRFSMTHDDEVRRPFLFHEL